MDEIIMTVIGRGGIPPWAYIVAFLMFVLNKTGQLDAWAAGLKGVIRFWERATVEEQAHDNELEAVKLNAILQSEATAQLAEANAQARMYEILEGALDYLRKDLTNDIADLKSVVDHLRKELRNMSVVAGQAEEAMRLSHTRLDSLAGIAPRIAQSFDELKPHIIKISHTNNNLVPVMGELEGAIKLLVAQLENQHGANESD